MAASIQGVNVVWGVPTAYQAGTGFTTTGAKFKNDGEGPKILRDADGLTKTVITNDPHQKLSLEVYPSGATPGTLPTKGSIVVVNSVNWMYIDGEQVMSNESEEKMTFELQKWPGVSLS
jgi:hypothetical protein